MNTLYPIFLKTDGAPVMVVGGGKVAEQKVNGLLEAGAAVTVFAPRVTERIEALAAERKITLHRRAYRKGDVGRFALVFAATNNPSVHAEIFAEASAQNVPVNVVDVPDLCNFYLGSIFQNGDLKVAVSTNGKSPTLGKIVRDRIAAEFGKGYPELLDTLGELRPSVHALFPEPETRKSVFESIVGDELKRRKLAGVAHVEEPARGTVTLVGAGPGDPDLITVKGLRLLEQADVIVYDALVNFELLDRAKRDCEKIFAGKRSDGHYLRQEEINALLAQKANEGKSVVRLKGGDPFVFGRGGEEMEFLRKAGVEVTVVPGITAGSGIASSLGIPLTHRGISSNAVFVTGSESADKEDGLDWKAVAKIDTIVIYMGIKNLQRIARKLTDEGLSSNTPAVIVFGGTTQEEVVVRGTLGTIGTQAQEYDGEAPGIVIVGDVAGFLVPKIDESKLQNVLS
ncbi:MAG TPA: siroheme synthase CysG [Bacteroidota bacterium]|nr:siroheme synthase CysG [Bacteroidota bacterium]